MNTPSNQTCAGAFCPLRHILISDFQIKDFVGRGIGAVRCGHVEGSTFGINAGTREGQFDVFRKCAVARDVWSGICETEAFMSLADCFAAALARHKTAMLLTDDLEFKQVEREIRIQWLNSK